MAPRTGTTDLFRVMAGEVEVGLVVLDHHSGSECVTLYELFLSTSRRNRGIGTKVLAAVEHHVMISGAACLEVWPRSLDLGNRSDAQLARWYKRHGYVSTCDNSTRLIKALGPH